jgi:hypothetical protein
MVKLHRGWGFPIALMALWIAAVAYTFAALTGMEVAVDSAEAPAPSMSARLTAGSHIAPQVQARDPRQSRRG